MKKNGSNVGLLLSAIALAVLILDTKTALLGAEEGLNLCIRSVIPALFPFLVCTTYLTGNLFGISLPFLRPIGRLCKMPAGSEGILVTVLLGGYPTGAQATAQAYASGALPREEALRILGFCNNAGPAFIFGILSPLFSSTSILFALWFIHILSAITVGLLLPAGDPDTACACPGTKITFTVAVKRAVITMAMICGWILVFRILLLFMDRWFFWLMPESVQIMAEGLLELTNGCVSLSRIDDEAMRFLFASIFLNAGGLCVGMQTISVCANLGAGYYFPGKVLQTCVGSVLCGLVIPILFPNQIIPLLMPVSISITAVFLFFMKKRKNNSSNFHLQRV